MSTKAKLTAYVDPSVHRALKVAAARQNEKESAIVERALRLALGIESADEARALTTLTADEAMQAALDECALTAEPTRSPADDPRSMIRAVLDTNVLVAGFLGPDYSPAHALLEAHREGEFELVSSPRLFAELDGVLRRPAFDAQSADGRAHGFVDRLAAATLFVADPYDLPHATPSRHDDLLVAVARAGGAKFVVSAEPDLLRSFVRQLTIASPEEFLAALDRVDQVLAARA